MTKRLGTKIVVPVLATRLTNLIPVHVSLYCWYFQNILLWSNICWTVMLIVSFSVMWRIDHRLLIMLWCVFCVFICKRLKNIFLKCNSTFQLQMCIQIKKYSDMIVHFVGHGNLMNEWFHYIDNSNFLQFITNIRLPSTAEHTQLKTLLLFSIYTVNNINSSLNLAMQYFCSAYTHTDMRWTEPMGRLFVT